LTVSAKGRVERAIRYIRDNFFAGRQWQGIDDLNAQAAAWCWGQSADRRCPEDTAMTVREAFTQERPHLLPLPDNAYPTDEQVVVSAGKTPYLRFDLNDYSIPHTHVRRALTVVASLTEVRVLAGAEVIAQHARSFYRGEQIEDPAHIDGLLQVKRNARYNSGQDRLAQAAPSSSLLLQQAASRGNRLSSIVSTLLQLLDEYGAREVEIAVKEAVQQGVPHPNAVRLSLERRREQRNLPPPMVVALPDNPLAKNLVVRPVSLALYDQLNDTDTENTDLINDYPGEK